MRLMFRSFKHKKRKVSNVLLNIQIFLLHTSDQTAHDCAGTHEIFVTLDLINTSQIWIWGASTVNGGHKVKALGHHERWRQVLLLTPIGQTSNQANWAKISCVNHYLCKTCNSQPTYHPRHSVGHLATVLALSSLLPWLFSAPLLPAFSSFPETSCCSFWPWDP